MRAQARKALHEEEEESAFVSMTDMTVGFLFIIMILLAFFAAQFKAAQEDETVPLSQYEQLRDEYDELRAAYQTLTEDRNQWRTLAIERWQTIQLQKQQIQQQQQRIAELEALLEELEAENPLEAYLASVSLARREVLERLKDAIKEDFPDLQVEISEESDALRFQGEGLFVSGRWNLTTEKRKIVERLAERLDEILPCYTLGSDSNFSENCNPAYALIEAVQIEGHTDNEGGDRVNRPLSSNRANETFFAMTQTSPDIIAHLNMKNQPVLSVAAYGPDRPVATNDTYEGRATNRRIDLRFIMVTPRDTDGVSAIKGLLTGLEEPRP